MDRDIRQIERGSYDDPDKQAALLISRLRAGEISKDQVEGAAYLGHPIAVKITNAEDMFSRIPASKYLNIPTL